MRGTTLPDSILGGQTLSLALMVLTFTVVMAKTAPSAELGFDPDRQDLLSLRPDKNEEASHPCNSPWSLWG